MFLVVFGVIQANVYYKGAGGGFNVYVVGFACMANLVFGIRTCLIKDLQGRKVDVESHGHDHDRDGKESQVTYKKLDAMQISGACFILGFFYCSFLLLLMLIFNAFQASNSAKNLAQIVSIIHSKNALLSSFYYFSYNLLSFMVLSNVTAASHSLLKAGKRISILVKTSLFLGEAIGYPAWTGVFLAVFGMLMYNLVKNMSFGDGSQGSESQGYVMGQKLVTDVLYRFMVAGVFVFGAAVLTEEL